MGPDPHTPLAQTHLQFRLPHGGSVVEQFGSASTLGDAREFIVEVGVSPLHTHSCSHTYILHDNYFIPSHCYSPTPNPPPSTHTQHLQCPPSQIVLSGTFPSRVLGEEDDDQTLVELGLAPSSVILVHNLHKVGNMEHVMGSLRAWVILCDRVGGCFS